MKKIFNFAIFFLFLILFCGKSYSQVNYKTDLLNFVWSIDCNKTKMHSILFTEGPNNEINKNVFIEGRKVNDTFETIRKIEGAGGYLLNLYFVDNTNKTGIDTIEIKGGNYRLINRVLGSEQIVQSGRNIKSNIDTSYFKKCAAGSEAHIIVSNLFLNKKTDQPTSITTKDPSPELASELMNLVTMIQAATKAGDYNKGCDLSKQVLKLTEGLNKDLINQAKDLFENQCNLAKFGSEMQNIMKDQNCPAYRVAHQTCAPAADYKACMIRLFPQYSPIHQNCP